MRSVVWPSVGRSEVVDRDEPSAGPGDVVVDVTVSVLSPGTERARLLGLPTAAVEFPHVPGYLAAGRVRSGPGMVAGARVAVRGAAHAGVAVAPARLVRAVPDHVPLVDAAVWQLALTALHGLALGRQRDGEPVAVVGAGLLGVLTRRLAAARGAPAVFALARSTAKAWAAGPEPATTFLGPGQVSGGAPLVLDVTGSAGGLATAIAMARDGGRVVLLGSPRAEVADVPLQRLYDRRVEVVGAHVATLADADEPALSTAFFDLLAAGAVTFRDVLPEHPAREAPRVYRRLVGDRSFVGAALRWDRASPPPAAERSGAASEAAAAPWPSRRDGSPAPVRFGLLGCGDIGILDAAAIAAAAGADLVACHDPAHLLAQDIAARFGARAEPDLAALLARRDVDAVLVATPHDTHEPIAVAALEAGKHVLLEKPLAQDLAAARRIVAAAETSTARTSVLLPLRTDGRFRQARAAIDAGLVGAPLGVAASYLVDKPPAYFRGGFSQRAPSSWRLSKARSGGGFLVMNLVHHLDAIRALLGVEADRVYADMTPSAVASEVDDVVTVVIRFGGALATVLGGASVVGGGGQQLRLWGEDGQVQILPEYAVSSRRQPPAPAPVPAGDPRVLAIARFAAAVRDGARLDVGVHDALAVQALIEAAYESARRGRAVSPAVPVGGRQP